MFSRLAVFALGLMTLGSTTILAAPIQQSWAVPERFEECYFACPSVQGPEGVFSLSAGPIWTSTSAVICRYMVYDGFVPVAEDGVGECFYRTSDGSLANGDAEWCTVTQAPTAGCGDQYTDVNRFFRSEY